MDMKATPRRRTHCASTVSVSGTSLMELAQIGATPRVACAA